ncbi:hypothetical protein ACF1G0_04510 [Streptomyces sp. NPDC013953]|uniref:DUF7144 family membrane protein n=1 Tax=Streptomyces sp. NPDC013953 TaxID=3364868 RepID=UPI0036FFF941
MGIAGDDLFLETPGCTSAFDLAGRSWIHLFVGALAVLMGVGRAKGRPSARLLGVVVASLLLIANFLSISASRCGRSWPPPQTRSSSGLCASDRRGGADHVKG